MITFRPDLTKSRGFWCEDADKDVDEALSESNKSMDSKLPITWAFDNMRLSQILMFLGGAVPSDQIKAQKVAKEYAKYLHLVVTDIYTSLEYDSIQAQPRLVCNLEKEFAANRQSNKWRTALKKSTCPSQKLICRANITLFNTSHAPNVVAAHASKYALTIGKSMEIEEFSLDSLTHKLGGLIDGQ